MKPLKYETENKEELIHDEAIKRINNQLSSEQDSRDLASVDKIFNAANGGQWFDEWDNFDSASTVLTNNGGGEDTRPRFEVNLGSPVISKLVGEQRRTDIGPKISPMGSGADKQEALTRQGLIRHIEKMSDARDVYDNSYDEQLQGGYGGFEIVTRFVDDDVFDQEIRYQRIDDATQSLVFGPAKEYTKADAAWGALLFSMYKDVFKATYPDADPVDFDADTSNIRPDTADWFNDGTIRLAKYWRKKSKKKTIVQLSDGSVVEKSEAEELLPGLNELALSRGQQPITIIEGKERVVDSFVLEKFILNGNQILESVTDYKGKYIPLIPVYGQQSVVGGVNLVHGKIRFSKDSARIFNYLVSSSVEKVALGPGAKILVTPEQIAEHETQWEQMNVSNDPTLQYNALDENGDLSPAPVPSYLQPPAPNQMEVMLMNDMKVRLSRLARFLLIQHHLFILIICTSLYCMVTRSLMI
jgi:hypothetical protein